MQLLGHKDIRMTLRYLQVTQQISRSSFTRPAKLPRTPTVFPNFRCPLSRPPLLILPVSGERSPRHAISLEMYRRQLEDDSAESIV